MIGLNQYRTSRTGLSTLLLGGVLTLATMLILPSTGLAQTGLAQVLEAALEAVAAEEWGEAEDLYERAAALDPDSVAILNNLGVTRRQLGDLPGAIAAYRQALDLDPGFEQAYGNLTLVLALQGEWEEAEAVLLTARDRRVADPTLDLYRGLVYERLRNWPESARYYGVYLQVRPSAVVAYRGAIAHWQAGEGNEAVALFRRAVSLDPAFGLYGSEAGLALAKVGATYSGIELLAQLPADWYQPTDFVVLARLAHEADSLDLAEAAIRRAFYVQEQQLGGEVPSLWLNDAGTIAFGRGETESAMAQLNAAIERSQSSTSPATLLPGIGSEATEELDNGKEAAIASANLAEVYLQQEQPALALAASQAAVELDPDLPQGHNNRGAALLALEEFVSAAENFQTALELDPEYWEAERNLAISFAHRGDREQAMDHLRHAMESAERLEDIQQLNQELVQLSRMALPEPSEELLSEINIEPADEEQGINRNDEEEDLTSEGN